ncbi:DUF5995 family protein [Nocardia alni]|uniref:DUF5995 family protein n=1 Tax=Nocardia alni TaxID=2815723 RepID=UPI001C2214F1|nr:DUF5995 family protein [Nocardia alni]
MACVALALGGAEATAAAPSVATAGCGSPLSAREVGTIAALSDTSTLAGTVMQRLEEVIERHHRITEILADHRDRRGLFLVGLDLAEQRAVMPLQRDPAAFAHPDYAHAVSLELARRLLVNFHGEFAGGMVEPHWAQYFSLAADCGVSGARVAMAGYNAHLTVDLTYSVAAANARPQDAGDHFKLVDSIARVGTPIIDRTKSAYGVDIGPLWRFYFLGEGLDLLVGQGVATGPMLEAADDGYNVIVFGNGLALQNPALHDTTVGEIRALHDTAETAFDVLARLGGL